MTNKYKDLKTQLEVIIRILEDSIEEDKELQFLVDDPRISHREKILMQVAVQARTEGCIKMIKDAIGGPTRT